MRLKKRRLKKRRLKERILKMRILKKSECVRCSCIYNASREIYCCKPSGPKSHTSLYINCIFILQGWSYSVRDGREHAEKKTAEDINRDVVNNDFFKAMRKAGSEGGRWGYSPCQQCSLTLIPIGESARGSHVYKVKQFTTFYV